MKSGRNSTMCCSRRVAGTGVIHGDAQSLGAQRGYRIPQVVVGPNHRLFGDLDHQLGQREVGPELCTAPQFEQCVGAYVEGEKLLWMERLQPVPCLPNRQALKFEAEADAVGVGKELLGRIEWLWEAGQGFNSEARSASKIDNGLEGNLDVLGLDQLRQGTVELSLPTLLIEIVREEFCEDRHEGNVTVSQRRVGSVIHAAQRPVERSV